jgi:hypothetical protein
MNADMLNRGMEDPLSLFRSLSLSLSLSLFFCLFRGANVSSALSGSATGSRHDTDDKLLIWR